MTEKPRSIEEATLQMLNDPSSWPRWPWLPMKKRPGGIADPNGLGYIYGDPGQPIILHVGNMLSTDMSKLPTLTFESVEALMQAGWVVD